MKRKPPSPFFYLMQSLWNIIHPTSTPKHPSFAFPLTSLKQHSYIGETYTVRSGKAETYHLVVLLRIPRMGGSMSVGA